MIIWDSIECDVGRRGQGGAVVPKFESKCVFVGRRYTDAHTCLYFFATLHKYIVKAGINCNEIVGMLYCYCDAEAGSVINIYDRAAIYGRHCRGCGSYNLWYAIVSLRERDACKGWSKHHALGSYGRKHRQIKPLGIFKPAYKLLFRVRRHQ